MNTMRAAKILLGSAIAVAAVVAISPLTARATIYNQIDGTTRYLLRNWTRDKSLKEMQPPQVLPIAKDSRVYGACGENQIHGDDVGGSSYCPYTHTIYLVPDQLQHFYDAFGPASVAYVVAHEFGHAIQFAVDINISGAAQELQADCIAGVFIEEGSKRLGITRDDVVQMAQAAYSIGSKSHGSGPQRSYALLSGMGVTDTSCTPAEMRKLSRGQITDPIYKDLTRLRSGTGSIDTTATPYPKTSVLGSMGL